MSKVTEVVRTYPPHVEAMRKQAHELIEAAARRHGLNDPLPPIVNLREAIECAERAQAAFQAEIAPTLALLADLEVHAQVGVIVKPDQPAG